MDFMNAIQTKDPDKIDAARQAYIAVGATPRKLQEAQKEVLTTGHGKINSGLNAFHRLSDDYKLQVELLEQAPKEVFMDYYRLASTAAKQLWIKEHGPLTAEQMAPVTAQ
jgi:DNA gyrase inhibitor GyrI